MSDLDPTISALRLASRNAARNTLPYVGLGDRELVDEAAVRAMRHTLARSPGARFEIRFGEGEKDKAPMLYSGEVLGDDEVEPWDAAVDPVEGTTVAAETDRNTTAERRKQGSYAIIGAVRAGELTSVQFPFYVDKLVVGPDAEDLITGDKISILGDPMETFKQVAKAHKVRPERLVVAILDRPRNKRYVDAALKFGVLPQNLRLLKGGDLEQGILTSFSPDGSDPTVHILIGAGGSPEAVIEAIAHNAMGKGGIDITPYIATPADTELLAVQGIKPGTRYGVKELSGDGPAIIAATGITGGPWLEGGKVGQNGLWEPGQTLVIAKR